MSDLENKINKYALHKLQNTNYDFNNLNDIDKRIMILYMNTNFQKENISEIIQSYKRLLEFIRKYTLKIEKMTVNIKKSNEIDSLNTTTSLLYKKFYISPVSNYNYIKNPNTISVKANYSIRNIFNKKQESKENKSLIIYNESSIGFDFKYNKLQKDLYFQNISFLKNNYELLFKFTTSRGYRNTNRRQTSVTNKVAFTKNFTSRSFLFRDFPEFDNINALSLVCGHKLINNYIDFNSSSKQLIAGTPSQDSIGYVGIVYENNSLNSQVAQRLVSASEIISNKDNTINNFKASLKYKSSLNSNYAVLKCFYRKIFYIGNSIIWQSNVESYNIKPLLDTKLLKSHETIDINDFKGVSNPGPRLENGDSIGMLNTLKFYNKIYFTSLPVFNSSSLITDGFKFLPFIHFNLLYHYGHDQSKFVRKAPESSINLTNVDLSIQTPRRNTEESKFNDTETSYSNLYFSAGMGINYISELVSFELYYNGYVKKNKRDIGTEFGFNIGLD